MKHARLPASPRFIGGLNWFGLRLAMITFIVINSAVTQWMAARFAYVPELGPVVFKGGHLYPPWYWAVWIHLNWRTTDDNVRMTLYFGFVAVVCGMIVSRAVLSLANMCRVRHLERNKEDIHGSARLANAKDVCRTGLLHNDKGVYVGGWLTEHNTWYGTTRRTVQYLLDNGPGHVIAVAPTRSGKGVGLVIPTLLAWDQSVVIHDIKGENWERTAGWRAQQGQLCFKFAPVEETGGSRFNPLAEMRLFTLRDVSDAQNLATMLIKTGEDRPMDRHWEDTAVSLTTGFLLHVCYTAHDEGRVACLADLAHLYTRPGISFEQTLTEVLTGIHDRRFTMGWITREGVRTATHPVAAEKAQEILDKDDKERSGVLSTAKTALAIFSDPLVVANTSASDFSVNDLVNHEKPLSLYIVVPNSDRERLRPLTQLIFTTIVNRLTEKVEHDPSKKNKHRLLFMIDEFPTLNRMSLFAEALSYMAGYGMKAYLITQDFKQIIDKYGENESIISNCLIRAAYAPNTLETCKRLSQMAGEQNVQVPTLSFSGKRSAATLDQMTATVTNVSRPLLTPDEISRLKPPEKVGKDEEERIVAPGEMLVFVTGHHVIRGTQILYFRDPVFEARSRIPAPADRYTIGSDGQVYPQPDLANPPNNVISSSETVLRGASTTSPKPEGEQWTAVIVAAPELERGQGGFCVEE